MTREMKMTKVVVKAKMPAKAKAGQLLRSHIEYDSDGDGATVTHDHQPDPSKSGEPWMPSSQAKKSFSSRMEAHHHMAQMAGVDATMDEQAKDARAHGKGDSSDKEGMGEGEGDPDEDAAESWGADPDPGAQAKITKAKKPARNA
jgi:hypothetical protein